MLRRAAAGVLALAACWVAAAAPAEAATVAFHLQDPRIDEASGLAVGVRSPGVVYVQNDSGDRNRVFALNERTGATEAVVTITGATNHDWEDLAIAPDAAGTPSLWVADTGDNDAVRGEVDVYRVDEPRIVAGHDVRTARADIWRVRYPGGPADAESLAVTPDGTPYVITKSSLGRSTVYRLPRTPDAAHVRTATVVGRIAFADTGTANPFGVPGMLAATGATVSRDGTLLVVRTYSDAYVWHLEDDDVAAALRSTPERVALPYQRQGEGVAVSGHSLLVDSEGSRTPVWQVPLPTNPAPVAASTTAPRSPSPRHDLTAPSHRTWALAVFVSIAIAAAAAWIANRRRRG